MPDSPTDLSPSSAMDTEAHRLGLTFGRAFAADTSKAQFLYTFPEDKCGGTTICVPVNGGVAALIREYESTVEKWAVAEKGGVIDINTPIEPKPTKAHELLSDSSRWIQGEMARDVNGEVCTVEDPLAVCFCLFGAVVASHQITSPSIRLVAEALGGVSVRGIFDWNDDPNRTFPEVRNLLLKLDI